MPLRFDVTIENGEDFDLLTPNGPQALEWLRAAPTGHFWGDSLAVEPRHTLGLLLAMLADGFAVPGPTA